VSEPHARASLTRTHAPAEAPGGCRDARAQRTTPAALARQGQSRLSWPYLNRAQDLPYHGAHDCPCRAHPVIGIRRRARQRRVELLRLPFRGSTGGVGDGGQNADSLDPRIRAPDAQEPRHLTRQLRRRVVCFVTGARPKSRDLGAVRDAVTALELTLDAVSPGADSVNVDMGRQTTIAEVASLLTREPQASGRNSAQRRRDRTGDSASLPSGRQPALLASTSLAVSVPNVETRLTVQDGLLALIEWCRDERPPDLAPGDNEVLRNRDLLP
jgi:hypothetical protein